MYHEFVIPIQKLKQNLGICMFRQTGKSFEVRKHNSDFLQTTTKLYLIWIVKQLFNHRRGHKTLKCTPQFELTLAQRICLIL